MTTCYFCKKKLNKEYIVEKEKTKLKVCSECKYIHTFFRQQQLAKRYKVVEKILKFLGTTYDVYGRHCTNCTEFRTSNRGLCLQYNFTGIGENEYAFPRSYANDGCSSYTERC